MVQWGFCLAPKAAENCCCSGEAVTLHLRMAGMGHSSQAVLWDD